MVMLSSEGQDHTQSKQVKGFSGAFLMSEIHNGRKLSNFVLLFSYTTLCQLRTADEIVHRVVQV